MLFNFLKSQATKDSQVVFSQEGEDLILNELLGSADSGFYVDIGAFDPWRFSNTAYFYEKGWRGINVDARPGFKALFDHHRPKDLNIECLVGRKKSSAKFFLFDEPALNTTCKKRAAFLKTNTSYRLTSIIQVGSRTLKDLLHPFCGTSIDFMNIDVEGAEMEVLRSNDWKKHRPQYLVLEILNSSFRQLDKQPCIQMMKKNGYDVLTKGLRSVILKNNQ